MDNGFAPVETQSVQLWLLTEHFGLGLSSQPAVMYFRPPVMLAPCQLSASASVVPGAAEPR